MTIVCTEFEDFLNTINGLVVRGLTFTAYTDKLRIVLTGGY